MDSSAFREWSVVSIPLALYIPFLSRKISLKTKANEKGDNTLRCKHCDQPSEGSLFSDVALQCCDFMLDQSNKLKLDFQKYSCLYGSMLGLTAKEILLTFG